jgi:hypothetical protein
VVIYPQKDLLVLASIRCSVNPRAMVWLGESGKLNKFNGLIETQTCDLPDCSIGPQPYTQLCIYNYIILCLPTRPKHFKKSGWVIVLWLTQKWNPIFIPSIFIPCISHERSRKIMLGSRSAVIYGWKVGGRGGRECYGFTVTPIVNTFGNNLPFPFYSSLQMKEQ